MLTRKNIFITFVLLLAATTLFSQGKSSKKLTEQYYNSIKQGVDFYNNNNYQSAFEQFENAINLSEQLNLESIDTALIFNAAISASRIPDNQKALYYLEKCIDYKYNLDIIAAFTAQLYRKEGDELAAYTALKKLFENNHRTYNIVVELANSCLALDKKSEAMEYIDLALINYPESESLYFVKAYLYDNNKEFEKAENYYQKAIRYKPDYFDAYYNLGVLHYNKSFEFLLKDVDSFADYNKRYKQFVNENTKKSKSCFEKALEIKPDDENTHIVINQVVNNEQKFKPDIEAFVQSYVNKNLKKWQTKGEFEKTQDYQLRVNEKNRQAKAQEFSTVCLDEVKQFYAKNFTIANFDLGKYDADNETFLIQPSEFDTIVLPVDIDYAPVFKENWNHVIISAPSFYFDNNRISISSLTFTEPKSEKSFVYKTDNEVAWNKQEITYQFDEIDIDVPDGEVVSKAKFTSQKLSFGRPDVDTEIPETDTKNSHVYALIIGNEDYTKFQRTLTSESNVDYARNDAKIFALYCEKTLGIPNQNITLLTDAISSQMKREIKRFIDKAQYGGSEVELIFYFSGHGFPDNESKEAYIMPVDISGIDVTEGIKLSQLYNDLTLYPTKKVSVFLDACFSGGGRKQGLLAAKAVRVQPKENIIKGKLVVFSSSSGEQESLFYNDKAHGMFTYFLLKKLQETKGEISYGELAEFLKKKVEFTSSDINYKTQTPEVHISPQVSNEWSTWKLK